MGAAKHPSLLLSVPTDAEMAGQLNAAGLRWRNDVDGSATDEKDCEMNLQFNYLAPMDEFAGPWTASKYLDIKNEEDLNLLMDTPQITAWILLVNTTPDLDGYVSPARASPGKARIVIPKKYFKDNSVYAHELGHNAGLIDRDQMSGAYCAIMQSVPFGKEREFVTPDERDKMQLWTFVAPW